MYIFHNRIVFSELMYDQRPSYSLMKSFILVLLLENVRVPITVKKASPALMEKSVPALSIGLIWILQVLLLSVKMTKLI